MEHDFWHRRWEKAEIGFHEGRANRFLTKHFGALSMEEGARVFLPLCGKTRDIHWLLARGFRVAGAELSGLAIGQLFSELGVAPRISSAGKLERHSAEGIDIFVGDIFDLTAEALGPVDAIYDRAALVALPADMRGRYAAHMIDLTGAAPQLLICFEYDQRLAAGPPFSIDAGEVERRYGDRYAITMLDRAEVEGGLKGKCAAEETTWRLVPRG